MKKILAISLVVASGASVEASVIKTAQEPMVIFDGAAGQKAVIASAVKADSFKTAALSPSAAKFPEAAVKPQENYASVNRDVKSTKTLITIGTLIMIALAAATFGVGGVVGISGGLVFSAMAIIGIVMLCKNF